MNLSASGEEVVQGGVGEEDEGLHEGEAVGPAGWLAFEEGLELLVLAVGVEERTVDSLLAAVELVVGRSRCRGRHGVRLRRS